VHDDRPASPLRLLHVVRRRDGARRYATFSDADFRLGLNAAQTTLGALAGLAGATLAR